MSLGERNTAVHVTQWFYLGFWEATFPFTFGKIFHKNWENKCKNTWNLENKGHFWIGNDYHVRRYKWPNKITVTTYFYENVILFYKNESPF